MRAGRDAAPAREIRGIVAAGCLANLTDGELLDRFLAGGDGAAFDAILARHGAMVWGVCRRVLGDHHDAEDAFQATCLVLARRARSDPARGPPRGLAPRSRPPDGPQGPQYDRERPGRPDSCLRGRAGLARADLVDSPTRGLDQARRVVPARSRGRLEAVRRHPAGPIPGPRRPDRTGDPPPVPERGRPRRLRVVGLPDGEPRGDRRMGRPPPPPPGRRAGVQGRLEASERSVSAD